MVDYETETDPDLKEALELSLTIRLSKEEDAAAATDTKDEHYKPHENFGTNKHITEEDEEPQGKQMLDRDSGSQGSSIEEGGQLPRVAETKNPKSHRAETHPDNKRYLPDPHPLRHPQQGTPIKSEPQPKGGIFATIGDSINSFAGGISSSSSSSSSNKPRSKSIHTNRPMTTAERSGGNNLFSSGGSSGGIGPPPIFRGEEESMMFPPAHMMFDPQMRFLLAQAKAQAEAAARMKFIEESLLGIRSPSQHEAYLPYKTTKPVQHASLSSSGGGGHPEMQRRYSDEEVDHYGTFDHNFSCIPPSDYRPAHPAAPTSSLLPKVTQFTPSKPKNDDLIKQALKELLGDKQQYLDSLLEFNPDFQFNEKLLEKILFSITDTSLTDVSEKYSAELRKQFKEEMEKQIQELDNKTQRDSAICLDQESQLQQLEQEIKSQNQTSIEIQEKLQEKSSELQVNHDTIAQDYKLLKEKLTRYFTEEEKLDGKYVKDMLNLLLEEHVHPIQSELNIVEDMFIQSGHSEWIKQVRLQTVYSLANTAAVEMADLSEIQVNVDKRISEFDSRNDVTLKNRKSPYLQECIIISDRLAIIAIAEGYYFKEGGFNQEALDLLYDNKNAVDLEVEAVKIREPAEKTIVKDENTVMGEVNDQAGEEKEKTGKLDAIISTTGFGANAASVTATTTKLTDEEKNTMWLKQHLFNGSNKINCDCLWCIVYKSHLQKSTDKCNPSKKPKCNYCSQWKEHQDLKCKFNKSDPKKSKFKCTQCKKLEKMNPELLILADNVSTSSVKSKLLKTFK